MFYLYCLGLDKNRENIVYIFLGNSSRGFKNKLYVKGSLLADRIGDTINYSIMCESRERDRAAEDLLPKVVCIKLTSYLIIS